MITCRRSRDNGKEFFSIKRCVTSKFQVMNTYCLHRRLKDTNISIYSLHPGVVETPVLKDFERSSNTMNLGVKFARLAGRFRVDILTYLYSFYIH